MRPISICALNGSVYGGATDVVLACDLRIGLLGIEWRMPATALGLHYYPSGLQRYVSRFGLAATKRAFLTARPFTDRQLEALGLFEALVGPEGLGCHPAGLGARHFGRWRLWLCRRPSNRSGKLRADTVTWAACVSASNAPAKALTLPKAERLLPSAARRSLAVAEALTPLGRASAQVHRKARPHQVGRFAADTGSGLFFL